MAILKGDIEFTGALGNLSAYNMHGINKTVLRTKGGADKKKILKSPVFKLTRDNFKEFSGCAKLAGSIRRSMIALAPLADYNYTPLLSSLAKTIQLLDSEHNRGERNICLSVHRNLLTGFSLNRNTSFESIVKHPISFDLNRSEGTASVQIPSLTPGVNLITSRQYPLFRFIVNLGCVADRSYSSHGYVERIRPISQTMCSEWHHTAESFDALEMSVKLPESNIKDFQTLILSIGIQMGIPVSTAVVNPVRYAGCAKIIGVA